MRGFKNIAELLTFVGLQIKKDKQSFGDVIHRASLIKQATKSFRNVVTHAGPKVQASMDDVPAEVTVQKSVTKIQALVRGKSMRDVLETVTTEVQAAPPQAVANLARQAMLTSMMAKKFKDPVMPRQRVGFVTGLATPDTAPSASASWRDPSCIEQDGTHTSHRTRTSAHVSIARKAGLPA